MSRHNRKIAVAIVVFILCMTTLVGEGVAQELSIKLVMNPSKTDIYLGSDPIALTARVKGKNLTYVWELLGPGKLDGKGSSVFYILPEAFPELSEGSSLSNRKGREIYAAHIDRPHTF